MSARDFLARVDKSHPGLELLEATVDEAAANVRVASLWANPSLSYDREEFFTNSRGVPQNYLRLELPLEISGRRGLRMKGAQLGLEAARATSARDRAVLLFEALGTYWRAAAARQGRDLLRQEHDALGRLVQAVRARKRGGDASGYDLDRLELEVGSLEDVIADAERELEGWARRLGLLAGAPGARLEPSEALTLPGPPPPLAGLLQQPLAGRDDYKAARLRGAQAEREVTAAGRGWVPGLVLAGGLMTSAVEENRTAWGYVAGLSLSLPVFDRGQGEAARARARLRQAQAEQRLIEAQATTEVLTAHAALTRSVTQAERFERTQIPRLERLLRRAEVSYQEGERPIFELLDILRTARAVRQRRVELRREARLSELNLWRALGRRP